MSGAGYDDYDAPKQTDNPKLDLNGDWIVEDWEKVGDSSPMIYGIISLVLMCVHFTVYFMNGYGYNTGFKFDTIYNAGMAASFILSLLFDVP